MVNRCAIRIADFASMQMHCVLCNLKNATIFYFEWMYFSFKKKKKPACTKIRTPTACSINKFTRDIADVLKVLFSKVGHKAIFKQVLMRAINSIVC